MDMRMLARIEPEPVLFDAKPAARLRGPSDRIAAKPVQAPVTRQRPGMPHVLELARDVLVLATRSSLVGRLLSATQGLVIDYLKIQFAGLETEALVVIYLDLAGRVIASHGMSSGRAATAARYAQEVTRQARAYSAASVVCSHQRPAPCPAEPCSEDVELTRQLAVSLGAAGIRLDDHIVVRGGSIYSFRDHGRLQVVPHGQ